MKWIIIVLALTFTSTIMAQQEKTFIYEITFYDKFSTNTSWGKREREIHRDHIAYLDSLTKEGKLRLAGIIDQGLGNQTGIIVLTTDNYEEAKSIATNDPSVRYGMMSVQLRPITLFFRKP